MTESSTWILVKDIFALGLRLMLGIGYSASIGGVSTLIGTAPNLVLCRNR